MITKILCLLAAMCLSAVAQTNQAEPSITPRPVATNAPALVITTNIVMAAPNVRVVNGVAYNSEKSPVWRCIRGTVQSKQRGVAIVDTTTYSATYKGIAIKSIAITNMPNYSELAESTEINQLMMRIGNCDVDGRTLELWDHGTPYRTTVIKTNRVVNRQK